MQNKLPVDLEFVCSCSQAHGHDSSTSLY